MDRRRWVIPLVIVGVVVVLGTLRTGLTGRAGGTEGGDGCGGLEGPAERPADVFTVEDRLEPSGAEGPDDVSDWYVDASYVMKLRPDVLPPQGLDRTALKAARPDLAELFDQFEAKDERLLHPADTTRSGRVSDRRGLDRTLKFSAVGDAEVVVASFTDDPDVEWIEQETRREAYSVPDDPYYAYQWSMHAMAPEQVWSIADGSGAVVAVVDTGVSEFTDGISALTAGFDFVEDDTNPNDENGHGTHVAGTIAQATDNAFGVVGLAKGAAVMPVRVLGADGSGLNSDVAAGIRWAVDHGADVINLSLGGPIESTTLEDAVLYAQDNGVIVVAATGNDGYTDGVGYPAAYDWVIAVGATDLQGDVAPYSNQGPEIDLVAPGGDTTADLDDDGYGDGVLQETIRGGTEGFYFLQGTSMATPHVAACAAILVSAGITDPQLVRSALLDSADDVGASGFDTVYGNGIVNPLAALSLALGIDPPSPGTPGAPDPTTGPTDPNVGAQPGSDLSPIIGCEF